MKHLFSNWKARATFVLLCDGPLAALTTTTPVAAVTGYPGSTRVFSAAGVIAPIVAQYRAVLGLQDNGGAPGSQPSGHREINWDGVPDQFAAPNFLPGDYFNGPSEPRARGAVLSTPGTGVQVSADSINPAQAPVRFGHINPTYSTIFKTFSVERLFSPIDSNIVDLTFFVPGTQQPALVQGFGAFYTDVDRTETSFTYFDKDGRLLGEFRVPPANNGLHSWGGI